MPNIFSGTLNKNKQVTQIITICMPTTHNPVAVDADSYSQDHLEELDGCNEHGDRTGHSDLQRSQRIIGVHEGVNEGVHHNIPLLDGLIPVIHYPPGHQRRNVMIPMRKSFSFSPFFIITPF